MLIGGDRDFERTVAQACAANALAVAIPCHRALLEREAAVCLGDR